MVTVMISKLKQLCLNGYYDICLEQNISHYMVNVGFGKTVVYYIISNTPLLNDNYKVMFLPGQCLIRIIII